MIHEEEREQSAKYELVLDNGLKIVYEEVPEQTFFSFNMLIHSKSEDDNKEINFAINHLIEHCMRIADPAKASQFEDENIRPKDCQTFYDRIEYRRQGLAENIEKILDCYGELFSNWHMPHFDAEKNVIFEEWCYVYNQKDKWQFLTNYLQNENNTYISPQSGIKLLTADYIKENQDNIRSWFNRQINYTQNFSKEDIIAYAKQAYCAENMEMRCSGNMSREEFFNLIKASSLNKIPRANSSELLLTPEKHIPHRSDNFELDIDDYKISSISMNYHIENPEHAKIMREFLKIRFGSKLQKEEPNAYIVDFTAHGIETKISHPKEKQMQDKMSAAIQQLHDMPITDREITILQKRLNNQSITPQLINNLSSEIYETAQIVVNGENRGFAKVLRNTDILDKINMLRTALSEKNTSTDVESRIQPQKIKTRQTSSKVTLLIDVRQNNRH